MYVTASAPIIVIPTIEDILTRFPSFEDKSRIILSPDQYVKIVNGSATAIYRTGVSIVMNQNPVQLPSLDKAAAIPAINGPTPKLNIASPIPARGPMRANLTAFISLSEALL